MSVGEIHVGDTEARGLPTTIPSHQRLKLQPSRRRLLAVDAASAGAPGANSDSSFPASLQELIAGALPNDLVLMPRMEISALIEHCESLLARGIAVAVDCNAAPVLRGPLSSRMDTSDWVVLRPSRQSVLRRALSRASDIVLSASALIVLAPALAAIAIAVRTSSRGPAFFRADRVGHNGKVFKLYKFRSMTAIEATVDSVSRQERYREFMNVQAATGTSLKVVDPSRITKVGRFLRKHSLDELPQFWNVLKGDLALVGARPCTPYEFELYQPWHRLRFSARPGLTGLWQAYGRSRVTFEEMVLMDYCYGLVKSVWIDARIIFKTVRVVLTGEGGH